MHLTTLGSDVILNLIVPLLSEQDVFSLSVVDKATFGNVGHLRFKTTEVSKSQGNIVDFLQPATLDTIHDITLNGDDIANNVVFCSPYFKKVTSATLVTPLAAGQQWNFSHFVRRLSYLGDLGEGEGDIDDETITSLSRLPVGTFHHLQTLCLYLSIPRTLGHLLNGSPYLTKLVHLPNTDIEDVKSYQDYADTLKSLLELCSNKSVLPGLRHLHVQPGGGRKPMHRPIRAKLLEGIWRAAASHGGWKLISEKPDHVHVVQYPAAHELFWSDKQWEFTWRPSEFGNFKACCESLGIYPRADEFISGKINIFIDEDSPPLGALMRTHVDCLNIETNKNTNLHQLFQLMTIHTTAITIKLDKFWGAVNSTLHSPDTFTRVKAMRIRGPDSPESNPTRHHQFNIGAGLANSLFIRDWQNLVHLSLPVHTFQTLPPVDEGLPAGNFAECGIHVGAYDLKWLASCVSLEAMQFTDWAACIRCELSDEVSFQNGLQYLPPSVVFVLVSGRYRCQGAASAHQRVIVEKSITDVLYAKKANVLVSLRRLRVGNH